MTPHREFQADDGCAWTAWDVIPSWGERRQVERRQRELGVPEHAGDRRQRQRRTRKGIRIALPRALESGWLAFESGTLRRRAVPIPTDWHLLPEDGLREIWRSAEQLTQRRRRLVE